MNVGFIGLGRMGVGMAVNLLKAGHYLTVYNRTPAKAEALVTKGAKAAGSIADACRGDAVITMLANDEAVENVVLGRDGVITNLPLGALHVSSSTISVSLSQRLLEEHAKKGQQFVSAPVFGRPKLQRRVSSLLLPPATPPQWTSRRPYSMLSGREPSSSPTRRRPPIS
jgi:3-hydroxyisobutyrate dehydrogenase-like beta-hydroxyacid dehydrogenase